jgi:hypothetical protein
MRGAAGAEKKTPALTVPQVREIFTRLLRDPPPSPRQIAREITAVLLRNEEARIYHWHAATGEFPPRRNRGKSDKRLQ